MKAANAEGGDSLGYEISMSQDGNTIAAGADDEDCFTPGINPPGCDADNKTDTSAGAVYVFSREGAAWKVPMAASILPRSICSARSIRVTGLTAIST